MTTEEKICLLRSLSVARGWLKQIRDHRADALLGKLQATLNDQWCVYTFDRDISRAWANEINAALMAAGATTNALQIKEPK